MTGKLQQEIKKAKPFESLEQEAALNLHKAFDALAAIEAETFRSSDLSPTQYNVLRILRGAGPNGRCGREIAERLVSKVPDVSRLLDRMEGMQLLRRERDAADRRHVTARITPKGQRVLDEATPRLEAFERERFGHLDAERLQHVIDGLADIREAL